MSSNAVSHATPPSDLERTRANRPDGRPPSIGRSRFGRPADLFRRVGGAQDGEPGQLLVVFALALVVVIGTAGLLIDGGMAYTNRRQAQNAADTAALAAAENLAGGGTTTTMTAAGASIAGSNLFNTNYTDCSGKSQTNGVVVNSPPLAGAFASQAGYVEVVVNRPMKTGFAAIVGQPCWMVSARAVAVANNTSVASCNFCSLNNTNQNHTLVLKNSATLRVDGEIYVNSTNGGTTDPCNLNQYNVCGDAFDVFGAGGSISAKTISVVGGWETHDQSIATADGLATGCVEHPQPPAQAQTANVCIHMPVLVDPLNNSGQGGNVVNPPAFGSKPVAGVNGCPVGATVPNGTTQTVIASGSKTLCPGTYLGGVAISGGTVTMQAGVYVMQGGGFQVTGNAKLDGSAGVMIYSSSGSGASSSTTQGTDLVPPPTAGLLNMMSTNLTSSANNVSPGTSVTFTLTLTPPGGPKAVAPTGTVDFYDGNIQICSASPVSTTGPNNGAATCTTMFANWGTRAISAVYSGDSLYNPVGNTFTETIKQPSGVPTGAITITSTGKVDISGPKSGPYSGLTIFQDRTSNLTITLSPGASSKAACPAGFMTAGVPPNNSAVPAACGAIGGLQGTVYAANSGALVLITASGMANLQVIAGEIEIDSGANARFGYAASLFANGSIHLVE